VKVQFGDFELQRQVAKASKGIIVENKRSLRFGEKILRSTTTMDEWAASQGRDYRLVPGHGPDADE